MLQHRLCGDLRVALETQKRRRWTTCEQLVFEMHDGSGVICWMGVLREAYEGVQSPKGARPGRTCSLRAAAAGRAACKADVVITSAGCRRCATAACSLLSSPAAPHTNKARIATISSLVQVSLGRYTCL